MELSATVEMTPLWWNTGVAKAGADGAAKAGADGAAKAGAEALPISRYILGDVNGTGSVH